MKTANPYLYFDGNTEEAFTFYRSVFGGDFLGVVRFSDFDHNDMGVSDGELDRIAHIALPLGNENILMGTDVVKSMPPTLASGNNFTIAIEADSLEEARGLFDDLSSGGRVEMFLQPTEWAELYGLLEDKFGVHWMVSYTGDVEFTTGHKG